MKNLMTNKVHNMDAVDGMQQLSDNSITGVLTDPPYGLSDHSNIREVLKAWLNNEVYDVKGGGFMSREWDGLGVENEKCCYGYGALVGG